MMHSKCLAGTTTQLLRLGLLYQSSPIRKSASDKEHGIGCERSTCPFPCWCQSAVLLCWTQKCQESGLCSLPWSVRSLDTMSLFVQPCAHHLDTASALRVSGTTRARRRRVGRVQHLSHPRTLDSLAARSRSNLFDSRTSPRRCIVRSPRFARPLASYVHAYCSSMVVRSSRTNFSKSGTNYVPDRSTMLGRTQRHFVSGTSRQAVKESLNVVMAQVTIT